MPLITHKKQNAIKKRPSPTQSTVEGELCSLRGFIEPDKPTRGMRDNFPGKMRKEPGALPGGGDLTRATGSQNVSPDPLEWFGLL